MLDSKSVKSRFFVSVVANLMRGAIGFFTGLLVARGLTPSGYGDFTFLLGSFVAIRSLLDMGSSNAFYTFISQRNRCRGFYLAYCVWLVLQFLITSLLVFMIMPEAMIAKIWLGHARGVILLAFAASFMQQQVWQTLNQIGEAARKTVHVQIIGMVVAICHLVLVSFLLKSGRLIMEMLFCILIIEYLLATLWTFLFMREREDVGIVPDARELSVIQMLREYWRYCRPLMLLSWIGFFYEFADRWLLQRFGGANQQGFYQIAFQFSAVSLLATSSILNVFWKEIAEANERGDEERVAFIYHRVNRGLVMFGAVLSGMFIPWTEQIVEIFLGPAYIMAAPVLLIMFLFPIHQSMGQIGGTMLLASGNTRGYMVVSAAFMLLSLPLSYLAQAPPLGNIVPGLGLGAMGLALKMVLLNIASVNVQAWIIARKLKWRYSWFYQVVGIGSVLGLGFMSKFIVGFYWNLSGEKANFSLLLPFLLATLIYIMAVAVLIWMMPWLLGMTKQNMRSIMEKLKLLSPAIENRS